MGVFVRKHDSHRHAHDVRASAWRHDRPALISLKRFIEVTAPATSWRRLICFSA